MWGLELRCRSDEEVDVPVSAGGRRQSSMRRHLEVILDLRLEGSSSCVFFQRPSSASMSGSSISTSDV